MLQASMLSGRAGASRALGVPSGARPAAHAGAAPARVARGPSSVARPGAAAARRVAVRSVAEFPVDVKFNNEEDDKCTVVRITAKNKPGACPLSARPACCAHRGGAHCGAHCGRSVRCASRPGTLVGVRGPALRRRRRGRRPGKWHRAGPAARRRARPATAMPVQVAVVAPRRRRRRAGAPPPPPPAAENAGARATAFVPT